ARDSDSPRTSAHVSARPLPRLHPGGDRRPPPTRRRPLDPKLRGGWSRCAPHRPRRPGWACCRGASCCAWCELVARPPDGARDALHVLPGILFVPGKDAHRAERLRRTRRVSDVVDHGRLAAPMLPLVGKAALAESPAIAQNLALERRFLDVTRRAE